MRGNRRKRLEHLIRNEVGEIIRREVRDPDVGFATVTEVRLSRDLKWAKVYVSVYGEMNAKEQSIQALTKAIPFVRTELAKCITIKSLPDIVFVLDESLDAFERVEELLKEIDEQAADE